jgi:hypothetical protein
MQSIGRGSIPFGLIRRCGRLLIEHRGSQLTFKIVTSIKNLLRGCGRLRLRRYSSRFFKGEIGIVEDGKIICWLRLSGQLIGESGIEIGEGIRVGSSGDRQFLLQSKIEIRIVRLCALNRGDRCFRMSAGLLLKGRLIERDVVEIEIRFSSRMRLSRMRLGGGVRACIACGSIIAYRSIVAGFPSIPFQGRW